MWQQYEEFLVYKLLKKRKLDRIYELMTFKEEKIINIFKLFEIFICLHHEGECKLFLELRQQVKKIDIYRAEIENYSTTKDLIFKLTAYHALIQMGVHIKDIRMPIRLIQDLKETKDSLAAEAAIYYSSLKLCPLHYNRKSSLKDCD